MLGIATFSEGDAQTDASDANLARWLDACPAPLDEATRADIVAVVKAQD